MTIPMTSAVASPSLHSTVRAEARIAARVAGCALLYKLAFFIYIGLVAWLIPSFYSAHTSDPNISGTLGENVGIWRHFETWDGLHYLYLARYGYGGSPESLAFYPLWPTLIRLVTPLFGGNFTLAALVLSNLFSTAALVALHRLVARRTTEIIANRATILLVVFPGSLFLCLPYTEAFFLLLCALIFNLLDTTSRIAPPRAIAQADCCEARASWQVPLAVAACAALAAFARPTGLLLSVPLLYVAWLRRETPAWRLVFLAPVVGLLGYFLVIHGATGDFAAGIKAQQMYPTKPSIGLLFDVPGFVSKFFNLDPIHGPRSMPLDRLWFILFAATLYPLWKLDKTWFAFAVIMGIAPAMIVSMMSFMRYASIIFPCFVVAALWLTQVRWRPTFIVTVAILLALQLMFVAVHTSYYWAA